MENMHRHNPPALCGNQSPLPLSLVHRPVPPCPGPLSASCKYLYLDQNILSKYKTTTTTQIMVSLSGVQAIPREEYWLWTQLLTESMN